MYFYTYGAAAAVLTLAGLWLAGVKEDPDGYGFSGFLRNILRIKIIVPAGVGLVVGLIGWLAMPVLAWNFVGNWILLFVIGIAVLVTATIAKEGRPGFLAWPIAVVAAVALFVVAPVTTFEMFHAEQYHSLLGAVHVSDFTQDVSPLDPSEARKVDEETARKLADKIIESDPGLGSRTKLGNLHGQKLNGCFDFLDGKNQEQHVCFKNEHVWVGPLVHSSVITYAKNTVTPGYIIVSAVNDRKVHLVTAIKGDKGYEPIKLRYLDDDGYFYGYVKRYLRSNGYAKTPLTDYSFELNDSGRPYWVATVYAHTIGFGGSDVTGVTVVDPQTGAIKDYPITQIPEWIDRVQPEEFLVEQLGYWGAYANGYWDSTVLFGSRADMVKVTHEKSLVVGADGQYYLYIGLQSAGSDTGTNSFALMNMRTKKTSRYMISGANEKAACEQAMAHPRVKPSQLTCSHAVLYSVDGIPTYFIPMKGSSGVVQMYAFVNVTNYQVVGAGNDVLSAHRDYQSANLMSSSQTPINSAVVRHTIEATVIAVARDGDYIYFRLAGQKGKEFFGTRELSSDLKWTEVGHKISIQVQEGNKNKSVLIESFQNITLDQAE